MLKLQENMRKKTHLFLYQTKNTRNLSFFLVEKIIKLSNKRLD